MIILNGNSGLATIRFTKGTTFVLPIQRESGTGIPNFTTLTWVGTIYTLSDSATVSTFTVTASDADNLTMTISAAITATLEWQGVKYGFNIKGTVGATVYIPVKGSVIVDRADGA